MYNEYRQQAEQYLEIGKKYLYSGNKEEARNNFIYAKAIADKEKIKDLIALIDSYLQDC
ncbi:MAG: hypothetical protein IJT36_00375 [Alphaproteobacteria bacterium]|nr:hypothetical protein [Alphaproteobacteria bacterium]